MNSQSEHSAKGPTIDFDNLIAGVANHEAKALTLALMGTKGEEHFYGADELASGVTAAQGDDPAWIPNTRTPITYCQLSFEPIGAVAKSQIRAENGRLCTAYALTEYGRQNGLALAGLALKWSLEYPDVSVQEVFGVTQSRTNNRPPKHRLAVVRALLAAEEGLSTDEIVEAYPNLSGLRNALEQLSGTTSSRLFDISTNQKNYDPLLTIGDPNYQGRKPFETLKPERRAIYDALRDLKLVQGIGEVTVGGLVAAAIQQNPNSDPIVVRSILMQGIRSDERGGLPPLSVAEGGRGVLGNGRRSAITVKQPYRNALEELMNELDNYERGESHDALRETALSIVTDESASKQVMQKAFDFSPKTKVAYGQHSLGETVSRILLSTSEAMAIPDIRQALSAEFDLSVGERAIGKHVSKLVKSGVVRANDVETVVRGRPQRRTYFRPVATE